MRGCNVSGPSCNPWFVELCLQQPGRYQPHCSWVLLGTDTFRYLEPGRYQPHCSWLLVGTDTFGHPCPGIYHSLCSWVPLGTVYIYSQEDISHTVLGYFLVQILLGTHVQEYITHYVLGYLLVQYISIARKISATLFFHTSDELCTAAGQDYLQSCQIWLKH